MTGHLSPYRSYVFVDGKDPVIDQVRTAIQDAGVKYEYIHEESGVSTSTMYNWFHGKTRRPQYATVMAVLLSIGKELVIVDKRHVKRGAARHGKLRVVRG